jgi:hypothetical protein
MLAIADGLSRFNKVASLPRESVDMHLACRDLGYESEEEMELPVLAAELRVVYMDPYSGNL